MDPNPQDVLPLPPRPSLEQYRTRAKDLVRAHKTGPEAVERWSQRWVDALWRAQSGGARSEDSAPHNASMHDAHRAAQRVARFANERLSGEGAALSQAQFVMARAHGFPSWPRLVEHLDALLHQRSDSARFEHAADAIVNGDLDVLVGLLRETPLLVLARSDRSHAATLLHYVSANGVENFRQRTPANIVAIAEHLLDAGADVRATCDVYGGGADTLGLVVTSAHPRAAGVQLALADLLLSRGASLRAGLVSDCLNNGCPEAAAHLVPLCERHGIALSPMELAGAGQMDSLRVVLAQQDHAPVALGEALGMAAWYDHLVSVLTMLEAGVPIDTVSAQGATALHIAAYRGHATMVDALIARGADVTRGDAQYRATPRDWANDALSKRAWQVGGPGSEVAFRTIIDHLHQAESLIRP